jgi:hypothetical protein
VTSSVSAELEDKARAAAALALPTEWASGTIQRAPHALRDLAERAGGLRPGQVIFASATLGRTPEGSGRNETSRMPEGSGRHETGSSFAYGLWWPWGDGLTTSMRIGLAGRDATQEALQRLRDTFGVEL